MGVKAGCKPRGDVLQGELDDAIFAASFDKLTRGEGPLIYRDPALFFRNTHPTAALSKLCRDVFGRMVSRSTLFDGVTSAVFDALPTSASRRL